MTFSITPSASGPPATQFHEPPQPFSVNKSPAKVSLLCGCPTPEVFKTRLLEQPGPVKSVPARGWRVELDVLQSPCQPKPFCDSDTMILFIQKVTVTCWLKREIKKQCFLLSGVFRLLLNCFVSDQMQG